MIKNSSNSAVRCAIILAGGEGQGLQPFVHQLRGDALPKQYVNFIGTRSMVEHTLHRVEELIAPERVFTVITEDHLKHVNVCQQLLMRPRGSVIIQPENKETGPGLLLALLHAAKRYPDSVVSVFPSDHFILEENLFMDYVEVACRVVERDPTQMLLLGVEPDTPDPEYGYILTQEKVTFAPQKILRFIEKPGSPAAQEFIHKGGLWNTLVMIFKAGTLLDLMDRIVPALCHPFERIREALGTAQETAVVKDIYRKLKPWNFSSGVLEMLPGQDPLNLSVFPIRGVFWSDWGSETRVLSDLQKLGLTRKLYDAHSGYKSHPARDLNSVNPLRR